MLLWMKRSLIELMAGAALGFVTWCLLGKRLTSMFFGTPGGSFSCQTDVQNALDRFVSMQLYSAIAGSLVAFGGSLIVRRWWAKARAKPAPSVAAGPVP